MGTRLEGRDKLLTVLSWAAVIVIVLAVVFNRLFGFPAFHSFRTLIWIYICVCAIGLVNALGFLRRSKR